MKHHILLSVIAAALVVTLSCKSNDNSELVHHHHDGEEHHDHSAHQHEHAHEHPHDKENKNASHEAGVIELDTATANVFGVHASPAEVRQFGNVVKASGTIALSNDGRAVVSAPVSGVVTLQSGVSLGGEVQRGAVIAVVKAGAVSGSNENNVALADLNAARAELDRLTPLFEKRLVTEARYNEARAAYERARAAYSAPASGGRASAPISGMVTSIEVSSGQYVEAGAPIASISTSDAVTLRADVPSRHIAELGKITDARIVIPSTGESFTVSGLGGRCINSSTAAAGASGGYVPVTFKLPANPALIPGDAVEVYISGASTSPSLVVPSSAIYEQQGDYCVFVRLDEDCYRKVPVTVGAGDGAYVVILSGVKEGDMVVDRGVTTVRLAGASGAVPAGHSHSH